METETTISRLMKRSVTTESGCLEWTGHIGADGYGRLNVDGRMRLAHRVAYMCMVGPIPDGMQLDHLCRNRACLNVEHLEPVTNRENQLRGKAPRVLLHLSGKCAKGHEMAGENIYVCPLGRRHCRACNAAAQRRYKERKTA